MKDRARQLSLVIDGIRACFSRLRSVADALHADLEVTTAMRAVIEAVAGQPMTVPALARAKRTSRQNIQVRIDALIVLGFCRLTDNPAHKRSPLVELTERGHATFVEIRRRERSVTAALAKELTPAELETTRATLEVLKGRLEAMETEQAKPNGDSDEQ